jgi:hypothetical protein
VDQSELDRTFPKLAWHRDLLVSRWAASR